MNQIDFAKREADMFESDKADLGLALSKNSLLDVADCVSDLEMFEVHASAASIRRECTALLSRVSAARIAV